MKKAQGSIPKPLLSAARNGRLEAILWLLFATMVLIGPLSLPFNGHAADVRLFLDNQLFTKGVKSLKEMREQRVVLQELDHSCGAAALATVLRYRFLENITESELIGYIFIFGQTPESGIKKYFKKQGFTLLDLKRAALAKGYKGLGYRGMNMKDLLDFLEGDRLPVLVPIKPMGYNHFVVIKGIRGDRVLFADPAFGNHSMTIARFQEVWLDGIGFIVKPPDYKPEKTASLSDAKLDQIVAAQSTSLFRKARKDVSPEDLLAKIGLSDRELDRLRAGQASPTIRESPIQEPSDQFLTIRESEPVMEEWLLQPFIKLTQPNTGSIPTIMPPFRSPDGTNIVTIMSFENFSGSLQLGEPPGNFADFSPPPGQPIQSPFSGNQ